METKEVKATVPARLAEKLEALALRTETPASSIIEKAIDRWIVEEENRYRLTLDALDDVSNGRMFDHQRIQAWADGLDSDHPAPMPQLWS